jgi:cytochrome P450
LTAKQSPAPYWDPYDAAIDAEPYPVWAQLRDQAPVYRNDRYDFWALSRFDDVEAAHKDPTTFSSERGIVLENMGSDMSASGMIIFLDPPAHTRLRSIVSRALTPRRVAELEGRVRALCGELLDGHGRGTRFDYVKQFAAQLPSRVISSLVGVPPEDQESQRKLVDAMFHIEPGVGMANEEAAAAGLALVTYLRDLVEQRTIEPRDDMVSDLVNAELVDDDGHSRPLTVDECTRFALLLYSAGTETVAKLLGNAAVVLAQHPSQRIDLVANPDIIPNAVEELLRFEAPSAVQGRWTTRDVRIHSIDIPKDAKVLLLTGSAGRDERVFPHPDQFDVRRAMQHHVSFGYGVHFCLGAALARLEGRVAIEETLKRFPTWEVDPDGVTRINTSTVRGYGEVQIIV